MNRVAISPAVPAEVMRSILQRIATGPELSKDLSREEACAGMRLVLEGAVDPVQAGVFLIALRMKRETDEENLGLLDALRQATVGAVAAVEDLVDLGDPYDGYARTVPASPFLPALLAACGVPAVSHGVERMGPKYGITHRQVLRAAGLPVDLDPRRAADRVADPSIGWAYLDQKDFAPKLHALRDLRALIVKRPAITTIEVLLGPVRARGRTHLVTGYVHKGYPRVYAMLARHAGFDSALIVRGLEGGVIPSPAQAGKAFRYREGGEEQAVEFTPADAGIDPPVRPPKIAAGPEGTGGEAAPGLHADAGGASAKLAAEMGLEALSGERGPIRESLAYGAALCLWHLGRFATLAEAADAARAVLDSGAGLARVEGARNPARSGL